MAKRSNSHSVYQRLLQAYGPQHWWPAETPFEVMVGAVLVQNTNWKNVERAIVNLKSASALEPRRLLKLSAEELSELIRPAGYFRIKQQRLRNLVAYFVERYGGAIERMQAVAPATLRQELLALKGIGPETADSILLYAVGHPAMVVDAYTRRVYTRHGWVPASVTYHQLQEHVLREMPVDVAIYNEFHALLVELGKRHCGTQARCQGCPLERLLPATGPLLGD